MGKYNWDFYAAIVFFIFGGIAGIGAFYKLKDEPAGFWFLAIGVCFLILTFLSGKLLMKENKRIKKLKKEGKLIQVNIYAINKIEQRGGNYRSRIKVYKYNIVCEWIDEKDNMTYMYKSPDITINVEKIINKKNLKTMPVYVNLEDKNDYYMDISVLWKRKKKIIEL